MPSWARGLIWQRVIGPVTSKEEALLQLQLEHRRKLIDCTMVYIAMYEVFARSNSATLCGNLSQIANDSEGNFVMLHQCQPLEPFTAVPRILTLAYKATFITKLFKYTSRISQCNTCVVVYCMNAAEL